MLLLLAGVAAVAVALFLFGRMRTRIEASFLAEELQEMGGGSWKAVPVNPAWGRFSRAILAGEVAGDRVEVAGSLLFLPFEHSRELAILRQERPARDSEAFVSSGDAGIDSSLAFRSGDPAWLRGFLARADVRQALGPLCARAGDDPSFVAVRAGRGVGDIEYRNLVGTRSGLFYFHDPEAGPLGAPDIHDLVRVLAPLKRAMA